MLLFYKVEAFSQEFSVGKRFFHLTRYWAEFPLSQYAVISSMVGFSSCDLGLSIGYVGIKFYFLW